MDPAPITTKTYMVEHLDPELGPWSALEYASIAAESASAGAHFCLSSASKELNIPDALRSTTGFTFDDRSVEILCKDNQSRVCLLDPAAAAPLCPEDGDLFDVFLFGGILGDDPPRDRTSELREKGYTGRKLGPIQMTTDTAVRVTRKVIHEKIPLERIPYIDHPELRIDEHESTEMPFRYVADSHGDPIMPKGMVELIQQDAEKGFGDLL